MIDWTKNLSPTRTCHLTIASNKLFATRGMLLTPPLLKLRLPDPKNRRRQEVRTWKPLSKEGARFPTAFVQSLPYSLFPSHQVGSSTSYQLAQQIVIINQKHSAQLEVQKRIFERQLQKRDEQLDKILKGMERNVNPEQIPRYEIYCNVRQGFVIHNFSGPLKLKRPWVTLSTTRTSAIPGMK